MLKHIKNLSIQVEDRPLTKDQPIEIIERKGKGHPDSLCDALVEEASIALNQLYLAQTGRILHYNLDKGLLSAGKAEPNLGGGKVTTPVKMIMGDRATFHYIEKELPVWDTIVKAAQNWISQNLRFLDPKRHLVFQNELRPGSAELTNIFAHPDKIHKANDTSAAVGFAPPTPTEKLVLSIEQNLQSSAFLQYFPAIGEDIKIMAVRREKALDLTIAIAMVDQFIHSEKDYFEQKEAIKDKLIHFIHSQIDTSSLALHINSLDQHGMGKDGLYLTVTGTSVEQGDSGQVGRGNQINGLICMHRPQSNEAVPGKNAVSHVGKIYNHLAYLLAEDIYLKLEAKGEVCVWLTSRIGEPINHPSMVAIKVIPRKGKKLSKGYQELLSSVIHTHFEKLPELCWQLIEGKFCPKT